jgi:hypothetical protein
MPAPAQIALRGPEMIAVDAHGPRVTVAECLHKNVFAGIPFRVPLQVNGIAHRWRRGGGSIRLRLEEHRRMGAA